MRIIFRILFVSLFLLALSFTGTAAKYKFGEYKDTKSIKSTAAGCLDPSGFRFLHVNNVRARINSGGDMWWNLDNVGQYYIPAETSKTSVFSGSLWIGGLDINNQLKLAAIRYRGNGTDYYTGPLTIDGTAAIDEETCSEWDKFFTITRAEVDEFIQWYNSTNKSEEFPGYSIPTSILEYPAHGDIEKGQSYYMAPFKDVDGDGDYDPNQGDYPYYDITNELCPLNFVGDPDYIPTPTMESELYEDYFGGILVDQVLKGDETLWWIFNDKGNVHNETEGSPIGMEIRAQAFGFTTNDEINNMSFYSYEIINRSTYELTQTYFSPWIDTDLGYSHNDFIGCDVERGLGYCYNGTPVDEGGPEAYGEQPPAVGVDFFQGPYMDPDSSDNPAYHGDGLLGPTIDDCSIISFDGSEVVLTYGRNDTAQGMFKVNSAAINGVNFGNGIVDDERYGMRRFVYHNNGGASYWTDPDVAPKYYNFLRGIWNDNTRMLYGGNGHTSSGALGPECDFMFAGDSDPCNWGTHGLPPNGGYNQDGLYWTEENEGNNPNDRRFMQSAGPFTLKPGAVNYITVGIPWARAIAGGPWASVELLRVVDDKCQALFDNCFKVINGPDAPDLTFRELSNELIVYITNSKNSNNFKESYKELDPQIKAQTPDSLVGTDQEFDPYYIFEGYQLFQLKDASVTISDSRYDADKVRLVSQIDMKNGVGQLVNFNYDQSIGANVPVEEAYDYDNGVSHSFIITEDAFSTGDRALVNNKQYYFSVLAYGYNNYKEYDQTDPTKLDGQKKPYLAGRKNIKLYTAIPHQTVNGTVMNSNFGDGPQITRVEGHGNGGNELILTDASIQELLDKDPAGPTANGDTIVYGDERYPIIYEPTYDYDHGPIDVKVIDPLNVVGGDFLLKFDQEFTRIKRYNVTNTDGMVGGGDTLSISSSPGWVLIDENTGTHYPSDTATGVEYEQLFLDLGISVNFGPVYQAGPYKVGEMADDDHTSVYAFPADNNGLINATIEYSDSSQRWLSGVPDQDIIGFSINWIRSGTAGDDWASPSNPWDPEEHYEKMISATFAPYALTAYNSQDESGAAPAFGNSGTSKSLANSLKNLYSLQVVLTPDKSKWTRSLVIEMGNDASLNQGGAEKYAMRQAPSVDKDGNSSGWPADNEPSLNPEDPNYIYPFGMGWFPGYAINLETGERMNIMFGEDSWLSADNGRDMLFNPSSRVYSAPSFEPIFGGKHYIYIMGSGEYEQASGGDTITYSFGAYDGGRNLAMAIDDMGQQISAFFQIYGSLIYASAQYVGIPLSVDNVEWLSSDVSIRINLDRPYEQHYAAADLPESTGSVNNHYPAYRFSTESIATTFNDAAKSVNDLNLVRVVPNPYYASAIGSGYEEVPLDNKVKITNLPEKATVSIYNISGTLIRKFTKDDPVTFLDWDLKNHAGIPIAGGLYLVHVKDELTDKETIVKWFGSLRVEDFNEF